MKYLLFLLSLWVVVSCNDGNNNPDPINDDHDLKHYADSVFRADSLRNVDTTIHASLRDGLIESERSGNVRCFYHGTEWWDGDNARLNEASQELGKVWNAAYYTEWQYDLYNGKCYKIIHYLN